MPARTRTAVLINLATIVERADEQVLPAVYKAIGHSLNASLSQLGALTTCRALVQTVASPVSGCLGDRFDRTKVIATGCFLWAVMTSMVGLSSTLHEAMFYCAINGIGLALVIPCAQSLIADYYHADMRGQAFGLMAFTGAVGGMLGGFFATNVSHQQIMGIEGWRFAFHLVAVISVFVGFGVLKLAVDPRYPAAGPPKHKLSDLESLIPLIEQSKKGLPLGVEAGDTSDMLSPGVARYNPRNSPPRSRHSITESGDLSDAPLSPGTARSKQHDNGGLAVTKRGAISATATSASTPTSTVIISSSSRASIRCSGNSAGSIAQQALRQAWQMWCDVRWMLGLRTFQLIVAQGIVGCFPWQAMVFFTLWLQLQGFSDFAASSLMAVFAAGAALGGWLGGVIGDRMAALRPDAGRIMTAQVSVLSGLPLTWILLKSLPASSYAHSAPAYAAVMFLLGLTCTWCGSGCNSPIFAEVVPVELRSTVYAFDRSFENAIASCAAPVVGLLAERVFKFQGTMATSAGQSAAVAAANAAALANSLAVCMLVPWSICLLFFTGLYWVYPHDKYAAGSSSVAAKRVSSLKAALC
jgi:MFS family permease